MRIQHTFETPVGKLDIAFEPKDPAKMMNVIAAVAQMKTANAGFNQAAKNLVEAVMELFGVKTKSDFKFDFKFPNIDVASMMKQSLKQAFEKQFKKAAETSAPNEKPAS